jgi:hypothetical protein
MLHKFERRIANDMLKFALKNNLYDDALLLRRILNLMAHPNGGITVGFSEAFVLATAHVKPPLDRYAEWYWAIANDVRAQFNKIAQEAGY